MLTNYSLDNLPDFIGRELGVSEWITIDQARIDAFADCTGDHQWIHVDVERARQESPLGTTIAHGYPTLSLLPYLTADLGLYPEGVAYALNYGADRIRFLSPVKTGARIRVKVVLAAATPRGKGRWLLKKSNTVEIEGEEKPAMVADTLTMVIAG